MRQSDYTKKIKRRRKAHFMKNCKVMIYAYAQDLMGWDPNDHSIRCPECRPTASHKVNPHCHLCGGVGETDIIKARAQRTLTFYKENLPKEALEFVPPSGLRNSNEVDFNGGNNA